MTELGDRIKAYRTKNNLTQPDACLRLFPVMHKDSTQNARAVYVSGLESGRNTMGETSPDFQNVMRVLGLDQVTLLKMLHADHRVMRKSARATGSTNGTTAHTLPASVEAAAKALDQKLNEIASASKPAAAPPKPTAAVSKKIMPKKAPAPEVSSFDPETTQALRSMQQKGARPQPIVTRSGKPSEAIDSSFEALAADVSYVIQKRSPALQEVHHQTLADFTRRVVRVASSVGYNTADDVVMLASDLSALMQPRAASQYIRTLPAQALREFVRRTVASAYALQEVQ